VDNFVKFKKLMIKRNIELSEEAIQMLMGKGIQNVMDEDRDEQREDTTVGEMDEIEKAIQMS